MRTTRNWCGGSPGTSDGHAWELVAADAYVVVHTPEHIVPGYSRKRDAFRPFEGKGLEKEEKDQAQRPQNGRPSLEAESTISLLSPSAACAVFGVLRFCLKCLIPSASVFGFRVSFVSNGDFNFPGIGADAYWSRPAVSRYTFIDSEHKISI